MDEETRRQVIDIADLRVGKYFDRFLNEVFPRQLKEVMRAHNQDVDAHQDQIACAVEKSSLRTRLWFVVLIAGGSGGIAIGIREVVAAFAGG